jgi:hypothetical protein
VNAPALIYGLCLAASAACAALLGRAYLRSRARLLLWTAISFCFLALNNLALVVDMIVLPQTDLWILRQAASGVALGVLLFGFVWETQ